jgi:hypothetical protein
MATVIAYASSTRLALQDLEDPRDRPPNETAYTLPDEASAGDRVLYYVAGSLASFVAIGSVESDWRRAGRGTWAGEQYAYTQYGRRLPHFVPGKELSAAIGLPVPKNCSVVPPRMAGIAISYLRGRPIDGIARALEGASTEARSLRRDPALRAGALAAAKGRCAGCDRNFNTYAQGFGAHCLVVHHTKQIRDYDQPRETKQSDLVVLCANCHMITHSNTDRALSLTQLRKKLGKRA